MSTANARSINHQTILSGQACLTVHYGVTRVEVTGTFRPDRLIPMPREMDSETVRAKVMT